MIYTVEGILNKSPGRRRKERKMGQDMTRLELMALLLSLEALLEEGKTERALQLIKEVLSEARKA